MLRQRYNLITYLLFLMLSIFILRNFLFKSGIVEYGDFKILYNPEQWISYCRYIWDQFNQVSLQIQQKIVYYFLSLLSSNIAQRLIYLIIFNIMFMSIYKLILYKTSSILTSIVISCFYVLNPILVVRFQHRLLLLGYALLPLFYLLIDRAFINHSNYNRYDEIKQMFLISLTFSFISVSPHWILFILLITIFIYVINMKMTLKYLNKINFIIKVGLLYICLSTFWILPYIKQKTPLEPNYVLTSEVLNLLSINANIFNVIRLNSFFWPRNLLVNPPISNNFYIIISLIFPIISFSALLIKRNKYVLFCSFISLLLIFLGKGTNNPFGSFYVWLSLKAPYLSKF
ncbi:MAG: hypothetical protein ACTSQJ_18270, partial [Promethearchaeota archaeon]